MFVKVLAKYVLLHLLDLVVFSSLSTSWDSFIFIQCQTFPIMLRCRDCAGHANSEILFSSFQAERSLWIHAEWHCHLERSEIPLRLLVTNDCLTNLYIWQSLNYHSRFQQLTLKTRSFHFGIMLLRGQPWSDWQKGTPQSIHLQRIYYTIILFNPTI